MSLSPLNSLKEELYSFLRRILGLRMRVRSTWAQNANRRSIIVIGIAIAVCGLLYWTLLSPPDNFPSGELVTIEKGQTLDEIGASLHGARVVRSPLLLRILVTLSRGEASVVAGDYQFNSPVNVFTVASKITTGSFGLVPARIVVPEGASVEEIAQIMQKRLLRFDAVAFLQKAKSLEGYLFPDTYFFLPNANEDVVIDTMTSNFDLQVASIHDQIADSGHSLEELVIMASLLEKEARRSIDRQKIAGVLWRRLDIGMALQVDATFLYFLGRTTFDLTLSDLKTDSPYNTYLYKGLPPGPITNPGLDSILAAATPIDTGALFYLADNNGITYYSKTYEEHLKYKAYYLGG